MKLAKPLKDAKPAGLGHNSDDEEKIFQRHKSAILRHQRGAKASAKALYDKALKTEKNLFSEAKNDGISIEALKNHLKKVEIERVSSGLAVKQVEVQFRYDKWGGLIKGDQGNLFTETVTAPNDSEADKIRWTQRGFDDIRFGATDPEGTEDPETGDFSPGPIMPNSPPRYVPKDRLTEWLAGASEANALNEADFLAKNQPKTDTPVEKAAATPKPEAEAPQAVETAPPAEKPKTQRERDLEASKAKANELAAAGAINTGIVQ